MCARKEELVLPVSLKFGYVKKESLCFLTSEVWFSKSLFPKLGDNLVLLFARECVGTNIARVNFSRDFSGTKLISMQDVVYNQSMKTGWKPPAKIRKLPESEHEGVRQKFHIIVEGTDLPPPVTSFDDLKLPKCILNSLKNKGINKPTPIQMQVGFLFILIIFSCLHQLRS